MRTRPVRGILLTALLATGSGCSSDRPGSPTDPPSGVAAVDPALLAELRRHVENPLLRHWLPGHLGDQGHAVPVHAQVEAIARDLAREDTLALRASLLAMDGVLDGYRSRPDHARREETILQAITICVDRALAVLDRARPPVLYRLVEDKG